MEQNRDDYKILEKELAAWEKEMTKMPSVAKILTKNVQLKVHELTPDKIQDIITISIQTMTKLVLTGSSLLTKMKVSKNLSILECDALVEALYPTYHKAAIAQGVGFGLGGFLVNLADLPALLTVQVKFLFDCCKCYGFDPDTPTERYFMLQVFHLAYSSSQRRKHVFRVIKNWESEQPIPNWEKIQKEYRDYLDIAKLLQVLPVIGVAAGVHANHHLMKTLKKTAMNAYRLRMISSATQT